MTETLKKLIKISGVSSREKSVAEFIKGELSPFVDEISLDALGNLIAYKKSKNENKKRIMLCAHMDEIGFIITYVQENGLLRISRVGGINFIASAYQTVVFENGVKGVIVPEGKTSPSELKQDKFYVDIGAKSKKEAEKKISVGDFCSLEPSLTRLNSNIYCGRPLDNRVGCLCLIEIAKKTKNPKNDIYFVFSTQEEVGLRGSKTASYSINPDIGIAFDVTVSADTPGAPYMDVKLGFGPAIKIKDSSVICSPAVVEYLRKCAEDNGIKYQNEILESGGTDTASMQIAKGGAFVGCISIPTRYIHTQNEMINIKDVKDAIALGALSCDIVL